MANKCPDRHEGNEKIEVWYKEMWGTGIHHKYIVYTDKNGDRFVAQGGPETRIPPWGDIVTESGTWNDVFETAEERAAREKDGREPIKQGENLEGDWEKVPCRP